MQLQHRVGQGQVEIGEACTSTVVAFVLLPSILHRTIHPYFGHNTDGFHIHGPAALLAAQLARDEVSAVPREVKCDGASATDKAIPDSTAVLASEASQTRNDTSKNVTITIEPAAKG